MVVSCNNVVDKIAALFDEETTRNSPKGVAYVQSIKYLLPFLYCGLQALIYK